MTRDDLAPLGYLPPVEPPEFLDQLVLERTASILDARVPAPARFSLSAGERLAYTVAVGSQALQIVHLALELLSRTRGG
jgi:hypothetical protein